MTEWKVGDKARILKDIKTGYAPNGVFSVGEIHTVNYIDVDGWPTFEGDNSGYGWPNSQKWFEKVEEEEPEFNAGDWVIVGDGDYFTPGKKYEVFSDNDGDLYLTDDEGDWNSVLPETLEEYQVKKTTPPETTQSHQTPPEAEDKTQKLINHLKNNPNQSFKGLTILEDFFGIKQETKTFWSDEQ